MSTPSTSVTVVGLGNMGEALAQAFLKADYKTTVWNRSPERAKDLVSNGAHLAKTVAESFEASDLIVVCLLDNMVANATLQQSLPSLKGRIVVNLTNGTPDHARQTGATALAQGDKYIHGGIMSVPQLIGTQASLTIHSGDSEVFKLVQKDLTTFASLYDLALLSGMYGLVAGFTQAASLVQAHKDQNDKDASLDDFVRTIWIPLLVQLFDHFFVTKGMQLDDKVYASKGSTNAMQIPVLQNVIEASQSLGVSTDLMRPVQRLLQAAVAGSYADGDIRAFVNLTRETEK
ncbi:hypothetical protein BGZ82_005532 [Podila clonocystis]|nr:hypothetical protein BGZ82_005532 [Podila clonocystis]